MRPTSRSTRRGVPWKEWNHTVTFLGISGSGKSVAMAWWVAERRAEHACYTIVHDPEYAFPTSLPDGRVLPHERHATIEAAMKALDDPARGTGVVHLVGVLDGADVVELGQRVGEASVRRHGHIAPPVIVALDEVANCEEAQSGKRLGPRLLPALTLRRHRHCCLLVGAQSAMLVHQQVLSKSTEIYCFRLETDADVQHLCRYGGFPQSSAAQIKTLKQFHFLRKVPSGFAAGE